ncbi:MAG: beta-glucosidase [Myxococcales bacterium]|nr:beta-glucosidase [Myxococcales bacterium]
MKFSEEFVWGTATSSFQIEGAYQEDHRSESIWDRFCTQKGTIADGSDGSTACDHYHLWPQDIALMRSIGVRSYRFSVAWPRILPAGTGKPNEAGLAFYERLVDELLEADIQPMVTLYHWDLPQSLQDRGGWPHRDTAKAFVEYAHIVSRRLGDRVGYWVTHNEPWCIATLGHLTGDHAPGIKSAPEMLATAHHVLLSHGWAVPVIRSETSNTKVGIVVNLTPTYPASPSDYDAEAARSLDGRFNRWYLDPLYKGKYPEDIVREYQTQGDLPPTGLAFVKEGDMKAISIKTDFLGINYYFRAIVRSEKIPDEKNLPREIPVPSPENCTDMGWEVYPDGLRKILMRVHHDYAPPAIYITENGCAYAAGPDSNDHIKDTQRIQYIESHIRSVHKAITEGAPVMGYYLWSLMDNFEWAFGYTKRFGMVWVDFTTQRRILKASAQRYTEIIRENAIGDDSNIS